MRLIRSWSGLLFAPSIRRTLLARSLIVGIAPIVLIAILAITVSQQLLQARFDDEARIVTSATANGINDRITLASRGSAVLAALPEVRDLTLARDQAGLRELLIPLKSRLALDLVFISDADGTIIAAQSGISKNTKAGEAYMGSPAFEVQKYRKSYIHFRNLEKLVDRVDKLEKAAKPSISAG